MENKYALSQCIASVLIKNKFKLVVAESCTGGGLAQELTCVSGSSQWFDRGFVTYSNQSKIEMLGVLSSTLSEYGAVSEQVAREMALGALRHSHADISLSITGVAGPTGGSPEKPVGLVCFGLARREGHCETRKTQFFGGRKNVRDCSVVFAMRWILEAFSFVHDNFF